MKKLDVNDYRFAHLNTVAAPPCEMQNSHFGRLQHRYLYCVSPDLIASAFWLSNSPDLNTVDCTVPISGANLSYQYLGRRRTETTHQQRVGHSESRDYWICSWRVASESIRVCVRARGGHEFRRWCRPNVTRNFLRDNNCQTVSRVFVAIQLIIQMCTASVSLLRAECDTSNFPR